MIFRKTIFELPIEENDEVAEDHPKPKSVSICHSEGQEKLAKSIL